MRVFKDKVVLITGHTGFKGSWLSLWLNLLGAKVYGLSYNTVSSPSNYEVSDIDFVDEKFFDINDSKKVHSYIQHIQPDFIFHMAAQALVIKSYKDPLQTFHTNAIGTANVLDALRDLQKDVVAIMITSDKVYDNVEWIWGYKETDLIGGKDPYSASKGMAELVIKSYLSSYFARDSNIKIGITRAGNVIGGGDWAKDRVVPDCVRSWSRGKTVEIRNPYSTRPWQHVLEPLSGYLNLARVLYSNSKLHGEAFNFGPLSNHHYSVKDLIIEMQKYWTNVRWEILNKDAVFHEAGLLKLNCDKALSRIKWKPTLEFAECVEMTISWYVNYYEKRMPVKEFSKNQINSFVKLASDRSIDWANHE